MYSKHSAKTARKIYSCFQKFRTEISEVYRRDTKMLTGFTNNCSVGSSQELTALAIVYNVL